MNLRSAISNVEWPAVPDQRGAMMLALQYQLAQSEWLPRDELQGLQMSALRRLLKHAVRSVPFYRGNPAYVAAAQQADLDAEGWRALPILSRPALQDAGTAMRSETVPEDHLPLAELITTGSTGRPVRAQTTRITALMWMAITMRDSLWHRRDTSGKLAAIRADRADRVPPEGLNLKSWGSSADTFITGPCAVLNITQDVRTQAQWLVAQNPHYLLGYPSNLLALAQHFQAEGARLPNLREVETYGETLTPDLRAACRETWGVPVVDMYSTQELGYIALQCPETEQYHVQSEAVYVEILDEEGRQCGPGQVGRVVVSTLHNYAMPMLRYEVGDYAEVGNECVCGRTLPVLNRVVGRERNMWRLPNGQRMWPMFSSKVWGHMDAIRQLQMIQHAPDRIEARIVGPRPLSPEEQQQFTTMLREHFPFPFELTLTHLEQIDRSLGMKFEDFVSFVP